MSTKNSKHLEAFKNTGFRQFTLKYAIHYALKYTTH